MALCLVGVIILMLTSPAWINQIVNNRLFFWITLLFLIEIFYRVIGLSTAAIGNYAIRFIAYVSVWVGIYISTRRPKDVYSSIVKFVFLVITFNIIDNLRIYQLYPELLGTGLFTNTNYVSGINASNLGTTSFFYMIMFVAISLFFYLRINKKIKYRMIQWFLFVGISVFILTASGSGTIIVSFISCIALSVICGKYNNKDQAILIIIISIILLAVLIIFSSTIIGFIIKLIGPMIGEKATTRLGVIQHMLEGTYTSTDKAYLARLEFIRFDFRNWFSSIKSFCFGNGYHTYSGISMVDALTTTGDGGHSGFVDLLPRYGLLGFFIIISLIKHGYRYLSNISDDKKVNYYLILFITVILNNVFNNIMSSGPLFVLFTFFPIILNRNEE